MTEVKRGTEEKRDRKWGGGALFKRGQEGLNEVILEQRREEGEGVTPVITWGERIQAKEIAGEKALRQEEAQQVQEKQSSQSRAGRGRRGAREGMGSPIGWVRPSRSSKAP